jgi:hypothetical protein
MDFSTLLSLAPASSFSSVLVFAAVQWLKEHPLAAKSALRVRALAVLLSAVSAALLAFVGGDVQAQHLNELGVAALGTFTVWGGAEIAHRFKKWIESKLSK